MNLRDLEYLVALDKYQHFGKAAKACYVSQPTLSAQFKKLEAELEVSLLDRSAKGVVFSEAGRSIVEKAKEIHERVDQIQEIGQYFKNPHVGTLRIGVIPTIGPYLLPHVIQALKKQYPDLQFYLQELKTSDIQKGLNERSLDLGILALHLEDDRLEELPLYRESFFLALSKQHHKANSSTISSNWIQHENLLLLEDGHCFRNQAISYCNQLNLKEKLNFRATSLETLKAMVEINEGITAVPELTAHQWQANSQSLQFLPFPSPIPQREVGLIFPKHSIRKKLYDSIGQVIQKTIAPKLKRYRKETQLMPI